MDWFLNHFLDILLVIIFIICISYGRRKGIARIAISIAGLIIAGTLAAFVSNSTYEYVYDHYVREYVISIIEDHSEKLEEKYIGDYEPFFEVQSVSNTERNTEELNTLLTNDENRAKLNNVFNEYLSELTKSLTDVLPDEIIQSAEEYLNKYNDDNEKKLEIFDEHKRALTIEDEIIRPVLLKTVKRIIFIITFILVSMLFGILSRAVRYLRDIPVLRETDSFLGELFGILLGIVYAMAAALLCDLFIQLTNDQNSIISTDIISQTYIFRYVYNGTFAVISALLK